LCIVSTAHRTQDSSYWRQWITHPQRLWLRRALFQVHLWSGIGVGLYILFISVTGSILVFSNELYMAATPAPVIVTPSGPRLTDEQLRQAAARAYPGFDVGRIGRGRKPEQAVSISLTSGSTVRNRLFDPYRGTDLGNAVPFGITAVSKLIALHDDLLAGQTGRRVNGFGALLVLLVAGTGIVVWWPGIATWRRSLTVRRRVGWQRFLWELHSAVGFWTLAFIVVFGLSGVYLGNPEFFQDLADRLEPVTEANAGNRIVDQVIYWLAYLHFGRINGIGIPCSGPGWCDWTTKSVWALFGLAPAFMFVTGAMIWWNRVLRKKRRA
jgi:uncharacterized iron-regulated membrane protein